MDKDKKKLCEICGQSLWRIGAFIPFSDYTDNHYIFFCRDAEKHGKAVLAISKLGKHYLLKEIKQIISLLYEDNCWTIDMIRERVEKIGKKCISCEAPLEFHKAFPKKDLGKGQLCEKCFGEGAQAIAEMALEDRPYFRR
jgi:hypothetical protein